jgi:hypothetical protein
LGRFEVNAMLGFVDFVLCLIPFDSHLYLQYSTYIISDPAGTPERELGLPERLH